MCPEGVSAGQLLGFNTPDGRYVEVEVPDGVRAGDEFDAFIGDEELKVEPEPEPKPEPDDLSSEDDEDTFATLGDVLAEEEQETLSQLPNSNSTAAREMEARLKARRASIAVVAASEAAAAEAATAEAAKANWACEWCGCGHGDAGERGEGPSGQETLCQSCAAGFLAQHGEHLKALDLSAEAKRHAEELRLQQEQERAEQEQERQRQMEEFKAQALSTLSIGSDHGSAGSSDEPF